MAKKMDFAQKSKKKAEVHTCPVCAGPIQYIKHVKAVKTEAGAWKFRALNTVGCMGNEAGI